MHDPEPGNQEGTPDVSAEQLSPVTGGQIMDDGSTVTIVYCGRKQNDQNVNMQITSNHIK